MKFNKVKKLKFLANYIILRVKDIKHHSCAEIWSINQYPLAANLATSEETALLQVPLD